jgi:anti-anti-sigma regulatory factor
LVFKGLLSIENANEFRDQLLKIIEAYEIFNFEIKQVEMMDLSFYQLLLAAKKTIESHHKQFNIMMSLPQDSVELLEQAGFDIDF